MNWISWIFDTSAFVPRWNCGSWPQWFGWVYIAAAAVVSAGYLVAIPASAWLVWRRIHGQLRRLWLLFGSFVFFCGVYHGFDVVIFWWPAYRLQTCVLVIDAILIVATLIEALRVLPAYVAENR